MSDIIDNSIKPGTMVTTRNRLFAYEIRPGIKKTPQSFYLPSKTLIAIVKIQYHIEDMNASVLALHEEKLILLPAIDMGHSFSIFCG